MNNAQLYARQVLESADKSPYDKERPVENPDWATRAVRGILNDLGDRAGIGHVLSDVSADVRQEMVESLAHIIRVALNGE